MNEFNKKPLSYRLGALFGSTIVFCMSVLLVILTIKLSLWILF